VVDLSLALNGAEHAALHVLLFTLRERINEPFALSLVSCCCRIALGELARAATDEHRGALVRREPQERSPLSHARRPPGRPGAEPAREYPTWRASRLIAAEALRIE
jgi:hypothetical protein